MEMSKALLIFLPLGVIFSAPNLLILFLACRKPGNSTTDLENNNSEIDVSRLDHRNIFKVGMCMFSNGLAFFVRGFFTSYHVAMCGFFFYATGITVIHFSLAWNNPKGRVWKLSIAAASLIILAEGIVSILLFPQSN